MEEQRNCVYTGNDIAWFLLRVSQYVGLKNMDTGVYSIVFQWVIKPLTVLKDKINLQMHHSQSCWGNYLRGSYMGNYQREYTSKSIKLVIATKRPWKVSRAPYVEQ